MSQSTALPSHPSPHRDRISPVGLAFGLFGGPFAWVLQFCVNYGLASHACFPHDTSRTRPQPGWEHFGGAVLAINLLAIALALAAAAVASRNWRATREEHPGGSDHLLEIGEGRSRFLALCGIMADFAVLLAIVANTIAMLMVPPCVG